MLDLLTPEGGAADAAPLVEATDWTPDADVVAAIVGGVPMECEINAIHPCTTRHPLPAEYMMVWAECNCDPADPNVHFTTPVCGVDAKEFLSELRKAKALSCPGCAFLFRPAVLAIKEWLPV